MPNWLIADSEVGVKTPLEDHIGSESKSPPTVHTINLSDLKTRHKSACEVSECILMDMSAVQHAHAYMPGYLQRGHSCAGVNR